MEAETIQQILTLLPSDHREKLFTVLSARPVDEAALERVLSNLFTTIDAPTREQLIGQLMTAVLPWENLVPAHYPQWRRLVRDAAIYVGVHLSSRRLIPKLVRQLTLPVETPAERRLLIFIEQMPALQKIGQTLARNRHLDPAVRAELTRLESAIQDVRPAEIFAIVQQQLGPLFNRYEIELQSVLLAEASVSAVLRFTWRNPTTKQQERGVFKVLKPYIATYFAEELQLLRGLAVYIHENRAAYQLPPAGLSEMLDEVRHLLERETDLPAEQATLAEAYARYQAVAGVRVPQLIQALSTPTITAMSDETGLKVTDALRNQPRASQQQLAARMVTALLATPLFAPEEESIFHADLHAGNLLVEAKTGALVILDWALVERLSRAQRRHFVMLFVASAWRDADRIFTALAHLSSDDLTSDATKAALIRGHIATYLAHLPPLAIPTTTRVLTLLDGVMSSGVRFPAELLLFRKMLFTLLDVLQEVAPGYQIDSVLIQHALTLLAKEAPQRLRLLPTDTSQRFNSHLTNHDLNVWAWTLPLLLNRVWSQLNEQMVNDNLTRCQQLLGKLPAVSLPGALSQATPPPVEENPARSAKTTGQSSIAIPITDASER
jgi:predicted unusual protein kinase regulating ubiquinone biosynthesis (AarF/ABC1/UbiB family)